MNLLELDALMEINVVVYVRRAVLDSLPRLVLLCRAEYDKNIK